MIPNTTVSDARNLMDKLLSVILPMEGVQFSGGVLSYESFWAMFSEQLIEDAAGGGTLSIYSKKQGDLGFTQYHLHTSYNDLGAIRTKSGCTRLIGLYNCVNCCVNPRSLMVVSLFVKKSQP